MTETSLMDDIEKLLAPIGGKDPAGIDLRYEGTYDKIQDARREDDPRLEQGIWKTKLKQADWGLVREIAVGALENKTKDLQVAAWLMEAWIQKQGFAGLHCGLSLIHELCQRFWEDLYPKMEEDNLEFRSSAFNWINEKLPLRLKMIPITHPESPDVQAYALVDWENACRQENLEKRDKSVKVGNQNNSLTTARILASAGLTSTSYFKALADDLSASIRLSEELILFLDEKCGKESPSLEQFKKIQVSIQQLVNDIGPKNMQEQIAVTKEAAQTTNSPQEAKVAGDVKQGVHATSDAERTFSASGSVQSRAEAYRQLAAAADFLMKTEPHSPTPYLVKRAVAWGNKTLPEVLQELVQDQNNLAFIYNLLGLNQERRE
jgi:type VI secretion system ImpA family protein